MHYKVGENVWKCCSSNISCLRRETVTIARRGRIPTPAALCGDILTIRRPMRGCLVPIVCGEGEWGALARALGLTVSAGTVSTQALGGAINQKLLKFKAEIGSNSSKSSELRDSAHVLLTSRAQRHTASAFRQQVIGKDSHNALTQ